MKTIKMTLASILFILFSGCNGQTQKREDHLSADKNTEQISEQLNSPRVNIKVNKQYDDKGRVIKFDSTYSYSYSSPGNNLQLSNDSIYSKFRSLYNESYNRLFNSQYDNIFFNDTLFKHHFFYNDYFQKKYELNRKIFERIFQQIDSIKWEYLPHNYPTGHEKKTMI